MDDEYELLEEDLVLEGLEPELAEGLLLDLLTPLLTLEKAASSIFVSVLVDLLALEEDLFKLSIFDLDEDCLEGLEIPSLLRLEV